MAGNPSSEQWYFPQKPRDNKYWKFVGGLNLGLADWMANVPDDTTLGHMSIPGTHDSCTYTYPHNIKVGCVKTQNWNISTQLNNGIRFLDLRCCLYSDGVIWMYHGTESLKLTLTDVLAACATFLNDHPKETVLLSIKKENTGNHPASDEDFIEAFNNNIRDYKTLFWNENKIPVLSELRGKLAVVSRVFGLDGIQFSQMDVEDHSEGSGNIVGIMNKLEYITGHLRSSIDYNKYNEGVIFTTFCSMNPGHDIGSTNYTISDKLNKLLYAYLAKGREISPLLNNDDVPYLGLVIMDFADNVGLALSKIVSFNDSNIIKSSIEIKILNKFYNNFVYTSSLVNGNDQYTVSRKVAAVKNGAFPSQGVWKIISAGKDNVFLYNTYYKEFMRATSYVKDNRRTVCTDLLGMAAPVDDAFIWTMRDEPESTYSFLNKKYAEYFYETSLDDGKAKDNRRQVACWQPKNIVIQSYFTIF